MLKGALCGALGAFGYIVAAYAFDYPAKDTDPFSPGHPYGQVIEPVDPCGGKK